MALIKESDIKSLQDKKGDAETTIRATSDAYDKASNELQSVSDTKAATITEQRGLNPNNLEALNSLIVEFESKLEIPKAVFKEFDPTGITVWGELVYEITDMDFVESNEDDWTTQRAQRDKELKERSDAFDAAQRARQKQIVEGISDEAEKEQFEKAFQKLEEVYTGAFKATQEETLARSPKEKADEILTKWIVDEVDNSDLVIRFNKEKEERKEAIADSFKRADRQKAILKENFDDLKAEKDIISSDNEIILTEFANEMGIAGDGEDALVKESLKRLKEKSNSFTASNALELTRDSLFALDSVIEKIKQACAAGVSSIKLTGDEISGTQIYSLIDLGFKITHDRIKKPGRNKDNTVYTIDWTFASSS